MAVIIGHKATESLPASFTPRLDILPPAQQRLWPELEGTPQEFTLHGVTAIALRLAHRPSVDFDWFSSRTFAPSDLLQKVPYMAGAVVRQSAPDTLTATVDRGGAVQVSFFGGLDLGQVAPAEIAMGPNVKVASLIDLAGFKVAVIAQRAESRDYVDIHALLTEAKIPLADMLASAGIIYGDQFNPLLSLKALAYFEDASLAAVPLRVREDVTAAVNKTNPRRLPVLAAMKKRGGLP